MKKHTTYCRPAEGKFNWEKTFDIKNLPAKLDKYGRVKVTFEKWYPLKTNKQLGYYHGGILPFLEKELKTKTFMTKDEWHKFLKGKFGVQKTIEQFMEERGIDMPPDEFKAILAEKYKINERQLAEKFDFLLSHSKYTEKQMSEFINQVLEWVLHFFNMQVPPATVIDDYI